MKEREIIVEITSATSTSRKECDSEPTVISKLNLEHQSFTPQSPTILTNFSAGQSSLDTNSDNCGNVAVHGPPSKSKKAGFLQRSIKNVLNFKRGSTTKAYSLQSIPTALSQTSVNVSHGKDSFTSNRGHDDNFILPTEECKERADSGIASEVEASQGTGSSISSNSSDSAVSERIPGICGIHNLGNTCYMNAVLQCLGHIDVIVEYFAMDRYINDINQSKKKVNKPRKGCQGQRNGELTTKLANLLRSLWSFGYTKELCKEFKDTVARHGEQYGGTVQHDAQEFLLWLLDYLHEDLSESSAKTRGGKKSLFKKKKQYTDEEVAARTLASCSQFSRSFILDVFQAQYKSSLICPKCKKSSCTFDPFLCISLPIPQKETRALYLIVIYKLRPLNPVKIGLSVPLLGSIKDLKAQASDITGIPTDQMIISLIYNDGDQCPLKNTDKISGIPEIDDCLFLLEVPVEDEVKVSESGAKVSEAGSKGDDSGNSNPEKAGVPHSGNSSKPDGLEQNFRTRSQDKADSASGSLESLVITVTNVEVKGHCTRRFGFPITFRVERNISFKELQIFIRRQMPPQIREEINREARNWKLTLGIRILGGMVNKEYLNDEIESPLCQPAVNRAISANANCGPSHLSVIAEWEPERTEWCLARFDQGPIEEDESVIYLEQEYALTQRVDLKDCIELHTKEEEFHLVLPPDVNCDIEKIKYPRTVKPCVPFLYTANSRTSASGRRQFVYLNGFSFKGQSFQSLWKTCSPPQRLALSGTKCPGIEHGCLTASSKYVRLCGGEYGKPLLYEECWTCPSCKTQQQKTTRTLHLWSLPDVLVFHLKRFQQANHWKGKISVQVDYPITGLDMTPHIAERQWLTPQRLRKFGESGKHQYQAPPVGEDCVYDLFAVCNHIGPYITSGHYTAYCKNSADSKWYCFDDSTVKPITEDQIVTKSSYLLFYQKRSAISRSVSTCSLSSSASHWSYRMSQTKFDENANPRVDPRVESQYK